MANIKSRSIYYIERLFDVHANVERVVCLIHHFPSFFLNASFNAGMITNRSPTTP